MEEEFREFFGRVIEKGFEDLVFQIYESFDRRKFFLFYFGVMSFIIRKVIGDVFQKVGIQNEEFVFVVKKMVDSKDGIGSVFYVIEYNMIKIVLIFIYVDSREFGGYSYESFLGMFYFGKLVVFIYDGNEGGVGLVGIIYENVEKLMEKSFEYLKLCKCQDGCFVCVFLLKCGIFNEFLDKWVVIKVWERILKGNKVDV